MSGFQAIALAGSSIVRSLNAAFVANPPILDPAPGPNGGMLARTVSAKLVNAKELETALTEADRTSAVTLLLYRVDVNRAVRAGFAGSRGRDGHFALALDLFYLVTAWSDNAVNEQLILGRTMQALADGSPLTGVTTVARIGGGSDEVEIEDLSLIIDELSNEAMMRIFDALPVKYRLSVPYIARLARISLLNTPGNLPVVEASMPFRQVAR